MAQAGKWTIEMYADPRGRLPVEEWLRKDVRRAGAKHVAKVLTAIDLLRDEGLGLAAAGRIEKIRGGLWELRATFQHNPYRVLFYNPRETTLVLLHGFLKSTDAIEEADIAKAERRMVDDRARRA